MRPNPRSIRLRRMLAGAVAAAIAATTVVAGSTVATPTRAGAEPDDAREVAARGDSLAEAAAELVSLETTAHRLQRQNAELVAARAANRAETVGTKAELSTTRANRRDRAVHTYIESFSGKSLDDVLRPTVSGQRLEILTSAADRADQNRMRVMEARVAVLTDELRSIEGALQTNAESQSSNREHLDTVTAKIAQGASEIGPSGPVPPAEPGAGPVARAARAAEDALVAHDLAVARTAAAMAAATAAPGDPDAIAVAYAAVVAERSPKAEHDATQHHLAEVVAKETDADGSELEAAWVATPAPARRATFFALSQVGKDYVYATTGPDTYDCSGLTRRAWQQNGIALPHFSGAQLHAGTPVAVADLRAGDLLTYGPDGSEHVVLYIGAGWNVEAKGTRWGVVVEKADTTSERYAGASRPVP